MPFQALDRQRKIFIEGVSGKRPLVPVDPDELAQLAERYMSRRGYAYIAGGAGREMTIDRNRSAFAEWRIQPRMLRDVSQADTGTELFGLHLPFPALLSPIGVLSLANPVADRGVAQGAAAVGVPFIFSNQADFPMEETALTMGKTPYFFQLYWSKNRDLVASLVQRAEACGCKGIVLTLDTTMLGWRPRDLDLGYLPFLQGRGIAQYTSDPVFQSLVDNYVEEGPPPQRRLTPQTIASVVELMRNYPDSFFTNLRSRRPLKAVRTFISTYTNPALNWDDLSFLREQTQLPIMLKGILHPDDARRAVDAGMDGIIVSNHGGRQVDGAVSSIEVLPEIASAIDRQIPIILDSGVRTGADIFKAIALGATAVGIGRPYAYGLAIGGARGVAAVLRNLSADFELTMRLSGLTKVDPDAFRELLHTSRQG